TDRVGTRPAPLGQLFDYSDLRLRQCGRVLCRDEHGGTRGTGAFGRGARAFPGQAARCVFHGAAGRAYGLCTVAYARELESAVRRGFAVRDWFHHESVHRPAGISGRTGVAGATEAGCSGWLAGIGGTGRGSAAPLAAPLSRAGRTVHLTAWRGAAGPG